MKRGIPYPEESFQAHVTDERFDSPSFLGFKKSSKQEAVFCAALTSAWEGFISKSLGVQGEGPSLWGWISGFAQLFATDWYLDRTADTGDAAPRSRFSMGKVPTYGPHGAWRPLSPVVHAVLLTAVRRLACPRELTQSAHLSPWRWVRTVGAQGWGWAGHPTRLCYFQGSSGHLLPRHLSHWGYQGAGFSLSFGRNLK